MKKFNVWLLTSNMFLLYWDLVNRWKTPRLKKEFYLIVLSPYFETLSIIFPYSAAMAAVGLLESFMTATIIDDMTDTDSDKNHHRPFRYS